MDTATIPNRLRVNRMRSFCVRFGLSWNTQRKACRLHQHASTTASYRRALCGLLMPIVDSVVFGPLSRCGRGDPKWPREGSLPSSSVWYVSCMADQRSSRCTTCSHQLAHSRCRYQCTADVHIAALYVRILGQASHRLPRRTLVSPKHWSASCIQRRCSGLLVGFHRRARHTRTCQEHCLGYVHLHTVRPTKAYFLGCIAGRFSEVRTTGTRQKRLWLGSGIL